MRPTSDGAFDIEVPFIDLIVCPSYEVAYNDSQLQSYGLTRRKYRSEGAFHSTNNNGRNTSLRQIFDDVTHDVSDMLSEVRFDTLDIDHNTFVEKIKPSNEDSEHIKVTTKYFDSFGRCYSIRPRSHVSKHGINLVDIIASMDITIYLGYPGQFMFNTKTRV